MNAIALTRKFIQYSFKQIIFKCQVQQKSLWKNQRLLGLLLPNRVNKLSVNKTVVINIGYRFFRFVKFSTLSYTYTLYLLVLDFVSVFFCCAASLLCSFSISLLALAFISFCLYSETSSSKR